MILRSVLASSGINPGIVVDSVGYNGQVTRPTLRVREDDQASHMDFGFMQLVKYVG